MRKPFFFNQARNRINWTMHAVFFLFFFQAERPTDSVGGRCTNIFGILGAITLFPIWIWNLIQATILDSRNILYYVLVWLPVTWLYGGQLKNFSFKSMERETVILCRNLQKYSAYKIEELIWFEYSNFIFVTSQLMTFQNGLFGHAQY